MFKKKPTPKPIHEYELKIIFEADATIAGVVMSLLYDIVYKSKHVKGKTALLSKKGKVVAVGGFNPRTREGCD